MRPLEQEGSDEQHGTASRLLESDAVVVENENDNENDKDTCRPLYIRVMQVVAKQPLIHNDKNTSDDTRYHVIRPAIIASELGLSLSDACAELCGLLAAVGSSATFSFQAPSNDNHHHHDNHNTTNTVMVFWFPQNFQRLAKRHLQKESLVAQLQTTFLWLIKLVKMTVAFGLLLSLTILCLAGIVAMVALVVVSLRNGNDNTARHRAIHQIRSLFLTLRQLLWFYALFGPEGGNDNHNGTGRNFRDPFLKEIAYDLSLVFSVCCGNPRSLWFWIRAQQLSRRQRYRQTGWAWNDRQQQSMDSQIDGVTLVRRGSWGHDNDDTGDETRPGGTSLRTESVLSVAVEFLFGPSPFHPGPSQEQRWKLRELAIFEISSVAAASDVPVQGIPLKEFAPFMDKPPVKEEDRVLVQEGLRIVAHFNGIPTTTPEFTNGNQAPQDARFDFPELLAESETLFSAKSSSYFDLAKTTVDDYDGTWQSLLYNRTASESFSASKIVGALPDHLEEISYRLTKLSSKQFLHCCLLGSLNLIGVVWLRQALSPGGDLEIDLNGKGPLSLFGMFLVNFLIPVLWFYARLFFAIPIARLILILVLNYRIRKRNELRGTWARNLEKRSSMC